MQPSKQRYRAFLEKRRAAREDLQQPATPSNPATPTTSSTPSPVKDWAVESDPARARKASRSAKVLLGAMLTLIRPNRLSIAFALATVTFGALTGLALPLSTKFAFDYVVLDTPGPSGIPPWLGLPTDRYQLLWLIGWTMVALAVISGGVASVGRYQMTRTNKLVASSMRRRVFDHMSRLPLHHIQALKSGGVSSILRDDAGQIGEMLFSVLYNPWRAVITMVGGLVAMAFLDWRMLVGGLLLIPAVYLSHKTWIARIRPVFKTIKSNRTNTDAAATESFAGIRVVRAFGQRRSELGRFASGNHLMARQEMLAWWWSRIVELVWTVIIPVASAAVIVYGGHRVLQGKLTIGDVAAFSAYLLMLLGPLEILVSTAASLQNSLAGFDRCLDLLEEKPEFEGGGAGVVGSAGPSLHPLAIAPLRAAGRITFERVSFNYPGHSDRVLQDIDLDVQPGESIALVGVSGSGKTTFCNLVARFYDPPTHSIPGPANSSNGRVLLDGVDLRAFDVDSYRRLLGIVEQDVFLFDGTVAENIAYGSRHATPDAVRQAAEAANAHEFIDRLEKRYDTVVGERGVRLSGGQKQRIAIARALLADPRILILDEATSNLDSESEALIQASLTRLMKGRTSFVIAHRLGTVRNASRIVVLEKGRIIEVGTHDELVSREGRYWEMLQVQLHQTKDYAGEAEPSHPTRPAL